jgi:mono/diheme cytochrome c family protein
MIARSISLFALLLCADIAKAADRAAGLKTARTLCVNCHVVEPGAAQTRTHTAGVPSFPAIAKKRGQTEDDLKLFMLNPHPPMPNVQLTTHELDNLASYIMSLKGQR